MKVVIGAEVIDLGTTEAEPTISIVDYSRRETDEFGVTTVVRRGFAHRMSVRLKVPTGEVDALQRRLADLRAQAAEWIADDRFDSLSFTGFFKEFAIDLAVPPTSFCTLTIEGLAETGQPANPAGDPAPDGKASTLRMILPETVTDATLAASNVPENDFPLWSGGTTYPMGSTVIHAHRRWESLIVANVGNEPSAASTQWSDIGPTNRWAMFDEALGTATSAAGSIVVTIDPASPVNAVALLDVAAPLVRVQATGYDRAKAPPASPGVVTFLDLPLTTDPITVTISSASGASVGTMLVGRLVGLGVTEAGPSAGITDYSKKEADDFGDVTIVERAWAKRMGLRAMLSTSAVDLVVQRLAAVRAQPCLWIGDETLEVLTVYGFYKDFSVTVGENVSTLDLTVEGLSKAAPIVPLATPALVTVYRNATVAPPAPDFDTGEVPAGWTIAPQAIPSGQYRWSTQANFLAGSQKSPWTAPVRVGGIGWVDIIDSDPDHPKPTDGADKTEDNTANDVKNVFGRPVQDVIFDLDLNGMNWHDLVILSDTRNAAVMARTTLEGMPIGTVVANFKIEQTENNQAVAETFSIMGAKSGDGQAWNWNTNSVMVSPGVSMAQYMQGVSASIGDVEASVTDLRQVLVGADGSITAKAVLALEAGNKIAGFVFTNNGQVASADFLFDSVRFLKPNGALMWGYDPARQKVIMEDVIVNTLEARTVKTESIEANSVTGVTSYGFPDVLVSGGAVTIAEITDMTIGDGYDGRALAVINFMQDGTSNIDTALRIITYVDVGGGYVQVRNHVQGIGVSSGNARWVLPASFSIPILANGPVKLKVTAQPYAIPGVGTSNSSYARNIQIDVMEGFR